MRTRSPRIIGREAEVRRLDTLVQRARVGRGDAVFLLGDAGIGKTRLAAHTISSALDSGVVVLRGRSATTGPTEPFRPLTEALLSLVRVSDEDLPARLGPYRPVLGRLVPEWSEPGNRAEQRGDAASQVVLAEAVLRLTALAGRDRGCLLVLDDLHNADAETLGVVDYLVGNLTGLPVALVGGLRPGRSRAVDLAVTADHNGDADLLTLSRLTAGQVHELVRACLDDRRDLDGIRSAGPPPGGDDTDDTQDGTEVLDTVAQRLSTDSGGSPLAVEELLAGMVDAGELALRGGHWRWRATQGGGMAATLSRSINRRVELLGPAGVALLRAAAVLGPRFPLGPVQQVTGLDDHTLLAHLQAAVATDLLSTDELGADWYAFRHPMTVEALRSRMGAADEVRLAAELTTACTALHPELPDELCLLVAQLHLRTGRRVDAGRLELRAGRRALAHGAPESAKLLLEQAVEHLSAAGPDERRAATESLVDALAETGQLDQAVALAGQLHATTAQRDVSRQVELSVRLAWTAQVAGDSAQGIRLVRAARALLPAEPDERDVVPIDAVEAHLVMFGAEADRTGRGEQLAHRAIAGSQRLGRPATTCQAWFAIAQAARERDRAESDAAFRRTMQLASDHDLTAWRTHAMFGLGGNAWLADADAGPLQLAHGEALRTGAIGLALNIGGILGMHHALARHDDEAQRVLTDCLEDAGRMKLWAVVRYALVGQAVLAAHRGDRDGLATALAAFEERDGAGSREQVLARGLAVAVAALLAEDRAGAEAELAAIAAQQSARASAFYLAGPYGLALLLDALAGRVEADTIAAVAAAASGRMCWNRHFLMLAEAVLTGRRGDGSGAAALRVAASRTAEVFPTARALGLRLVAEAAIGDGWGEPGPWLIEAEEHFHRDGLSVVAGACRRMLRTAGEPVRQRRTGSDQIPEALRRSGVTAREFEVYRLLVHRLGNKELAARLHISPRTVEKHVAALIDKTGSANRGALTEHAVDVLGRTQPI